MTVAWRIVQSHVAGSAFTGEGARRFGGRWNNKGVGIVYTSGSISLAILEVLVHIPVYDILDEYVCIPVEFDLTLSKALNPAQLPADWNGDPAPQATKQIGDSWIKEQNAVILEVPSAIVPVEKNYLIDPSHQDFNKLKIGSPSKFEFDPRLLNV